MKTQRLRRLSKVRPKEFTEREKRELEHRQKYGETRAETYNKLARSFKEGLLSKGQFKKYKHALDMDEKFGEYKSYKKYMKEGLEGLTKSEFKKADKFVGFGFDVNEFGAYKKLKKEGLGKLSQPEFNAVNRIRGMQIASEAYNRRKNVLSAKDKELIQEKGEKLQLKKDIADLKESEKNLLNSIGFNISDQVWRRSKQIQKAKNKGLITVKKGEPVIAVGREGIGDLSLKDVQLLRKVGIDVYRRWRTVQNRKARQEARERRKKSRREEGYYGHI